MLLYQWFLQLALLFSSLVPLFKLSTLMFMGLSMFLSTMVCFFTKILFVSRDYLLITNIEAYSLLQMLKLIIIIIIIRRRIFQKLDMAKQLARELRKKLQNDGAPRRYIFPRSGFTRIIRYDISSQITEQVQGISIQPWKIKIML